jgi:uncharacterized damage-inducible protein DinB
MSEGERIADQLKRSIRGTAWHGPSVGEILGDVTAEEAVRRPLPAAHTMAELVLHITAWIGAAAQALDGAPAQLAPEDDWPAVTQSFDWNMARHRLLEASKALGERLRTLGEADLERSVRGVDQVYTTYLLTHGVVQHNLYHAGQLALLKKVIRGS